MKVNGCIYDNNILLDIYLPLEQILASNACGRPFGFHTLTCWGYPNPH
ncbi:hypothetical protein [Tannockella kyphosi]|nr:hypothetical protein [Tannockella kyphosi]